MIKNGCEFCNNAQNILPAKYVKSTNELYQSWIENAHKRKKFIFCRMAIYPYKIMNICPICRHRFTDEDYDNYN